VTDGDDDNDDDVVVVTMRVISQTEKILPTVQ
jgi:hypothetical protein